MDSMTFVLFGATGDLAKRKIFPALYNLFLDEKLAPKFSIVGSGRSPMDQEEFRLYVERSLKTFSRREENESRMREFLSFIRYIAVDVTQKAEYDQLLDLVTSREKELNLPENRLFYLSVAPQFFDVIASNIQQSGLGSTKGWKRLIIEKPFGHDLPSARELNEKLSKSFEEEEIYRIDHYLGKPMVQNLEAIEFANPILQALWNKRYIANVQITASEIVGVEERAGYYDKSGAIRDMIQNHMLQMMMLTAMHIPEKISANGIRDEKKKVMEALRPLNPENINADVIRGQYSNGEIKGKKVIGYTDEPGIEPTSKNDTFIAARLWVDNEMWEGVPFYLRTGKRMTEKSTRIVIEFKDPLKGLYQDDEGRKLPNLLTIEINPNAGVSLQLNSKNLLNEGKVEPINVMFYSNDENVPEAYELLIHDALLGDPTFFAHWNEVELAWKWVQPILDAFEADTAPIHHYKAGTMGPEASDKLLADNGFKWW
jgi:glucose-6-phosphate 1-dehydrogenase